jgi:hypothetical protein
MHKRGPTVNQQHPPAHHPLDARYYSVVDEPNFTKFHPEKYDFNLYKGFSMKKKAPNLPNFEGKKSKLPDFYDKFQ